MREEKLLCTESATYRGPLFSEIRDTSLLSLGFFRWQ